MANDAGLIFAKLLEGVSGGLVTGRKYQIEEQDKKRKEDAEAALKKALMDHQLSQDDFNRSNTNFDNEVSLANASRHQVGRNPDGSIAYDIAPADDATLEKLRLMLHPTTAGVPTPPAAGVVPGAPAAPALAPSPVPTAGLDPTTRSSGMIPPPAPQIQLPALPPVAAPIAGKVVNAPQTNTNIPEAEFAANPKKYLTTPNLKVVSEPSPDSRGFGNRLLPADAVEKLAGYDDLKYQSDLLKKIYDPKYVGLQKPLIGRSKQYIQNQSTPEGATFYQTLQSIKDQLLYLRSGKQINETEYKRLTGELPDEYKSDTDFRTRVKNFDNLFDVIVNNRLDTFGKAGYNVSQFKKRGATSKPKTVIQNGHAYTLNEATGEYE